MNYTLIPKESKAFFEGVRLKIVTIVHPSSEGTNLLNEFLLRDIFTLRILTQFTVSVGLHVNHVDISLQCFGVIAHFLLSPLE